MNAPFSRHNPSPRAAGTLLLALAAATLAGCSSEAPAAPPGEVTVTVGAESVHVVARVSLAAGPQISGQLEAERAATVRAEVAGAVLAVPVEEGQAVARGALLARIDDATLREGVLSARSGVRSAEGSLDVARRNAERSRRLTAAGAQSQRELETAELAVSNAEAMLADARARLALAEEQLAKADVRAPFAGVVSRRAVSAGDTVAPGGELVTVVDPARMKLVAAVPVAGLADVRLGAPVVFTVAGYPGQRFAGTVDRINPVADPATRQIQIQVGIPNQEGRLVAGLFAEGRVETRAHDGLAVPDGAVEEIAGRSTVLVVRDGRVARNPVELGLRDEASERVEIVSGVAAGDRVLLGAARSIAPGTPVEITRAALETGAATTNAPVGG